MLIRGESKNPYTLLNPGQLPGAGTASQRPGLTSFTTFRPATPAPSRIPRLLQSSTPAQPAELRSSLAPLLESLAGRIQQSLRANLQQLLQLNPSRREAVCRHLEDRAGTTLAASGSLEGLRQWLDPALLQSQPGGPLARAVEQYLVEISVFTLAQALLLKAWSDRGNRKWKREDLQDLNSSLHGALRPLVPMDREGWQITRPNLYSWFKLPTDLQDAIWKEFAGLRLTEEGPDHMVDLLMSLQPLAKMQRSYDPGVFGVLWQAFGRAGAPVTGVEPESSRKRWAFCPTLRDGAVVRTGPAELGWYGCDGDPIQLHLSEFGLLWWGPSAPPFWCMGTGLESLGRDQLSLNLSNSAKPSLQQRIAEMEACDVAWVSEEQVIRGTSRSVAASRLREAADQFPALKRLRSGGTSLGHLQACVALAKLRPGGQLWWLRDEALHASDGSEALQYLLDRGRLVAEWDLSGLQLEFSVAGTRSPLPRHLSLWLRDTDLQRKLSHQPLLIQVRGQIRSHVELAPLLEEAVSAALHPDAMDGAPIQKNGWQIRVRRSPQPQRDWANHWPESVREEDLQLLEALRQGSQPLAGLAVIRPAENNQDRGRTALLLQGALRGFRVRQTAVQNRRRLVCEPLQLGADAEAGAFAVMIGDESLSAPIKAYLESEWVSFWLDHKAELRGQRWNLREQDLRMIPVPSSILPRQSGFATPLPGSWERLSSEMTLRPGVLREALKTLAYDADGARIRAEIFVRAARILDDLRSSHARISEKITQDGRIIWKGLLDLCNPADLCPMTLHPEVKIQSGSFPLQTPIVQATRAPRGQWALRLTTEAGHSMQVEFQSRGIYEILAEQIEALDHPTWGEIVEQVRAPRRLEELELRASEMLRTHGEQKQHITQLEGLVSETLPALLGR